MGQLRDDLNEITMILDVEEYMSSKIGEVEKSLTSVGKAMSTIIENSIANIKDQIKSKVEEYTKIQPKQISKQIFLMIKTKIDMEN